MQNGAITIPRKLVGFPYGYLVGVLYGDGAIVHKQGEAVSFRLTAIDEDFHESFSKNCQNVFARKPSSTKRYQVAPSKVVPKGGYAFCTNFNSKEAVAHLECTFNKDKLPDFSDTDFCKGFLVGLLDSEGYCCRVKRYDKHEFRMGIATRAPWIFELQEPFARFGVKTSTHKTHYKRSQGEFDYYTLYINKMSFAKSELRFTIARKNKPLEQYLQEHASTTARVLAGWDKARASGLATRQQRKIQSDLQGKLGEAGRNVQLIAQTGNSNKNGTKCPYRSIRSQEAQPRPENTPLYAETA